MNHGFTYRTLLIRLPLATTGIAVLAIVWARFGAGDSQPVSVGESVVASQATPQPLSAVPAGAGVSNTPSQLPATPAPTDSASGVALALANHSDEELKAKFHGIWMHSENGSHWIENRPDGTARMLLKLDFVASLLYGKQTHLDLTWDVKDGVLSHTIVSGTPVANVDSLVKDYGKSRRYTILETTPERMLLQSLTDKQKDLWTRTQAPLEWSEVPRDENLPAGQEQ